LEIKNISIQKSIEKPSVGADWEEDTAGDGWLFIIYNQGMHHVVCYQSKLI